MVNPPRQQESLFQRLGEIVGARNVSTADDVTARYQVDGLTPSIVISTADVEQVSQVVRLCNQYQAGLVPWGGGTKQLVGQPLSRADVVLDLKPMHKIVELDLSNFTVQVEAGMINGELQKQLAGESVFLPYDPAGMETSTIGGELATNASGPLRAEYGTARDIVLGVTAVTPGGDIVHTGGKTMKNVAGIDLCKLLIGSWGTLGIITDAVMRIFPIPEVSQSVLLTFAGIEDASNFVSQLLVSKLTPGSVELLDRITAAKLESAGAPSIEENGILLMTGVSGSREDVERHRKEIDLFAGAHKVLRTAAVEGDEATRLWQAYSGLPGIILESQPNMVRGKASVPLGRQGEMFRIIKEAGVRSGVAIGITVHGYSGILYSHIDTGDADPIDIINDLSRAAGDLGGFFIVEFAPLEVRKNGMVVPPRNDYTFMQSVKTSFDPANILNPGKLVRGSG